MSDTSQTEPQALRDQIGTGLAVPGGLAREALPVPTEEASSTTERNQPMSPSSGAVPADLEARTRFVDGIHEYIRDNIRLADQKATFFFTGATALLAFLYKNDVSSHWLKSPVDWRLLDTVAFVAMVALAVGALLALTVVIPRTPGSRRGFIFWEAIAECGPGRQYADDLSTLSPATLFQMKADHCFDLAKVCRAKYKWLRAALWVCAVGLGASLVVFLFLATPTTGQPTVTPSVVKPTP